MGVKGHGKKTKNMRGRVDGGNGSTGEIGTMDALQRKMSILNLSGKPSRR